MAIIHSAIYLTSYYISKVVHNQKKQLSLLLFVRPEGFEPSTLGAEIRYSIQLNYGRNFHFPHKLATLKQGAMVKWSANLGKKTKLSKKLSDFKILPGLPVSPHPLATQLTAP